MKKVTRLTKDWEAPEVTQRCWLGDRKRAISVKLGICEDEGGEICIRDRAVAHLLTSSPYCRDRNAASAFRKAPSPFSGPYYIYKRRWRNR